PSGTSLASVIGPVTSSSTLPKYRPPTAAAIGTPAGGPALQIPPPAPPPPPLLFADSGDVPDGDFCVVGGDHSPRILPREAPSPRTTVSCPALPQPLFARGGTPSTSPSQTVISCVRKMDARAVHGTILPTLPNPTFHGSWRNFARSRTVTSTDDLDIKV